jgi:hypothetical protein
MLVILRRCRLLRFASPSISSSPSSSSESAYVRDDDERDSELRLRRLLSDSGDDLPKELDSVLLSRSNDDICRRSASPTPGGGDVSREALPLTLFKAACRMFDDCLLLPTRLKLRIRANVLDVSDRALSAGEGGEKSGSGKSDTGAFQ